VRVVWICLDWPSSISHSGGVARFVSRLAAQMCDLVDLTVVTHADADDLDGVTMLKVPVSSSRIDRFYRAPFRASAAIRGIPADIVHAHGDDWALRTPLPVVRSFYGSSWSEARTSKGLRKYNHVVLAALEHVSSWRAARKIAIAPESAAIFHCDTIMPPLGDRPPALERQPTAEPSVIFVGSFTGRKRGYLVQEAVEHASRQLGGHVRLMVIGPADDAASWGPNVEHLSGLADDEVAGRIASAWVLMAPSSYEGFGIPTVEGLSLGVPVITSSNPGSTFVSQGASPALPLMLVDDPDQYGACLVERLSQGPMVSPEERQAADQRVRDLYEMASPRKLLELYEGVVGGDG
jgi:glycosyltransferase involved in cell wall biosynthesis